MYFVKSLDSLCSFVTLNCFIQLFNFGCFFFFDGGGGGGGGEEERAIHFLFAVFLQLFVNELNYFFVLIFFFQSLFSSFFCLFCFLLLSCFVFPSSSSQ